jgi:hypothetical protein
LKPALRLACGLLAACLVHAAQAQPAARWWLGFMDTRGHAFLELPQDARNCAARAAQFKGLNPAPAPGSVIAGGLKAEAYVPPNVRLLFGVTGLRGEYDERVMTRVAAIAREAERPEGACWYLAEPATTAADYRAEEDRMVFATLPPRRLAPRLAADDWRAYGTVAPEAAGDRRFAGMEEAPGDWRAQVEQRLPGYTQVYGQRLDAVMEKGGAPQALLLIGAINDGDGLGGKGEAYNTLNMIFRSGERTDGGKEAAPLYLAGPSGGVAKNRAGSFVAQAVAALDLDGDGIDEIVLRARYFTGGNLKVLKLVKGRYTELRQSAYEGE